MARALIVGCGCRGRALAAALVERGHAVRGATRDGRNLEAIEEAGAEGVVADPERLGTLLGHLEGVSVLLWLMGSADGRHDAAAAVNGPRLESLLAAILDAPVRGFVYEAAGTVSPEVLERGAAAVTAASARFRIPAELIECHPDDHEAWLGEAVAAFERVLE